MSHHPPPSAAAVPTPAGPLAARSGTILRPVTRAAPRQPLRAADLVTTRLALLRRELQPALKQRLRSGLPDYRWRTRGVHPPAFDGQQAVAVARQLAPAATPAAWNDMAVYLVALSGLSACDDHARAPSGRLGNLSPSGELDSIRMQMALDRDARLLSTLANLLKKGHAASSGITSRIK